MNGCWPFLVIKNVFFDVILKHFFNFLSLTVLKKAHFGKTVSFWSCIVVQGQNQQIHKNLFVSQVLFFHIWLCIFWHFWNKITPILHPDKQGIFLSLFLSLSPAVSPLPLFFSFSHSPLSFSPLTLTLPSLPLSLLKYHLQLFSLSLSHHTPKIKMPPTKF